MSESLRAGVTVRAATVADAAALAAFAARAFRETYAHLNDEAQTSAHVTRTFSESRQRAEIDDPMRRMLVIEVDGALAAYALVHLGVPAPAGPLSEGPAELERIYVDAPWHGRGLSDALMDAILEVTGAANVESLWLSVWEENARAIRFYQRRGFREVGMMTFMYGHEAQLDKVLVRSVRERRGPMLAQPAKLSRPAFMLRLQRGREGRDLIACVRSDGTTSWLRRRGGLPRRDRALIALEGTLGVAGGVFAQVAEGRELIELLRAEHATDPGALGWSLRFAALLDAEAASPKHATLAEVRAALTAAHDAEPVALDDASLARVRAAMGALESAWGPLAADEALEFVFAPSQADGLGPATRIAPPSAP